MSADPVAIAFVSLFVGLACCLAVGGLAAWLVGVAKRADAALRASADAARVAGEAKARWDQLPPGALAGPDDEASRHAPGRSVVALRSPDLAPPAPPPPSPPPQAPIVVAAPGGPPTLHGDPASVRGRTIVGPAPAPPRVWLDHVPTAEPPTAVRVVASGEAEPFELRRGPSGWADDLRRRWGRTGRGAWVCLDDDDLEAREVAR